MLDYDENRGSIKTWTYSVKSLVNDDISLFLTSVCFV